MYYKVRGSTMRKPILHAEGLGKYYGLYDSPLQRMADLLWHKRQNGFWALRNVSFDVAAGESFAIIGRNGGGKSTLLQLIAGVLQPTEGVLEVDGNVSALLELGSGFHPEFTGRENVFLYGDLHGIPRQEMKARFDEIVAFAEIGSFLDQPVKYYSSGMFVRLAFAVATAMSAELLLIDEALAVGDVFFRQKCYDRLETLRRQGTAIILVSHAMGEVQEFCQRALLLQEGAPVYQGQVQEAVNRYYLLYTDPAAAMAGATTDDSTGEEPAAGQPGLILAAEAREVSNGEATFAGISLCRPDESPCRIFAQGDTVVCTYAFDVHRPGEVPVTGLVLRNDKNIVVHGKSSLMTTAKAESGRTQPGRIVCRQEMGLNLAVGEYTIEAGLGFLDQTTYDRRQFLPHEEVEAAQSRSCVVSAAAMLAVVRRKSGEPMQLTHHGLCDLPGSMHIFWHDGES